MNSALDKMEYIYTKYQNNLYNGYTTYIYDWLILGNLYDALYFKGDAVLSVFDDYYKYINCFSNKDWGYIDICDNNDSNIVRYFVVAFNFLDRIHNENKICIVHCTNDKNQNRSAAIVFAYYLYKSQNDFYEVYEYMNLMRPGIINNINFRKQIILWAFENNLLK